MKEIRKVSSVAAAVLLVGGALAFGTSSANASQLRTETAHAAASHSATKRPKPAPTPAAPNPGKGNDRSADRTDEVRIGPTIDDSVLVGISGEAVPHIATQPPITVQSIPFNPIDSLQCDLLNNADHVLTTIDTFPYNTGASGGALWPGGDVDLLCGTDTTSGFKHIRARHQWPKSYNPNGWETVRDSASGALGYTSPQSWDEYMIHAVQDTLDYAWPSPVVNKAQQKICFSAPFHIFKGGKVYATYYANTVVSKSNFTIVTAYPSANSQASACDWTD